MRISISWGRMLSASADTKTLLGVCVELGVCERRSTAFVKYAQIISSVIDLPEPILPTTAMFFLFLILEIISQIFVFSDATGSILTSLNCNAVPVVIHEIILKVPNRLLQLKIIYPANKLPRGYVLD